MTISISPEPPSFLQATVLGLHPRSDHFFDFMHAGEVQHCHYVGAIPGAGRLAAGQRVVLRGRWSPAVLQVFEADLITLLGADPAPAYFSTATLAALRAGMQR